MNLDRTCKEVTVLLVAREDRELGVQDGLALRSHIEICEACGVFEAQMLTMRRALSQWRNYAGEESTD